MTEMEELYQDGLEDGYALGVLDMQRAHEEAEKARKMEEAKKFANWRKAERNRLNSPWPTLDEEQKEAA